ncbi:hypothetical protein, partial [Bizionia echini]|uniref:hypothetical protein n=1 Tax=Bizionia echini TaxID=649333 RepID=UPI0030DB4EB6
HRQRTAFVTRGEGQRPPSGVPLGTTVLQTRLSGQYYQLKQEDLGLFLKEILYDWILPSFKGQKNIEHSLMVSEFDEAELDKFRGLILKNRTNKSVLNFIDRNKRIPSTEEAEVLKGIAQEQLKTAKEVKIPKGFYDMSDKNKNANQAWMADMDGILLEMHITDTSKRKQQTMSMRCIALEKAKFKINSSDYKKFM